MEHKSMNNPETGCPELDETIRRLARVIEQVKNLVERNRELQKEIDRMRRAGLESKKLASRPHI